jgi:hypothetical protein
VLRIRDVYPGSRILIFTHPRSRIPDSKTATKEGSEKNICYHTFFSSHKLHKNGYYFIFEMLKKKMWANFQRIIEIFYPNNFHCALKYMGLGSGIRDPEKTYADPWVKKAPDPGSATLQYYGSGTIIPDPIFSSRI